jgi:hypothetical protein
MIDGNPLGNGKFVSYKWQTGMPLGMISFLKKVFSCKKEGKDI